MNKEAQGIILYDSENLMKPSNRELIFEYHNFLEAIAWYCSTFAHGFGPLSYNNLIFPNALNG